MAATRFIALHCGDEAQALLENHPNAFLLLSQIAMRAKWKDCPITGMKAGEAFVGDWKKAGLHSEKSYRHAKKVLTECKIAAFKGASKGTVATLMDTRIFSVSMNTGADTGADEGRARGGQGATNHTDTQNTLTPFALDGASSPPSLKISWNADSGFSGITDHDRSGWLEAFPAVNINRQLAAMSEWLKSNPAKSKKSQWRKFITGWLSRHQDKGGDIPSLPTAPAGEVIVNGRRFRA